MPHALHSTGLLRGPLRHCGLCGVLQWWQGPSRCAASKAAASASAALALALALVAAAAAAPLPPQPTPLPASSRPAAAGAAAVCAAAALLSLLAALLAMPWAPPAAGGTPALTKGVTCFRLAAAAAERACPPACGCCGCRASTYSLGVSVVRCGGARTGQPCSTSLGAALATRGTRRLRSNTQPALTAPPIKVRVRMAASEPRGTRSGHTSCHGPNVCVWGRWHVPRVPCANAPHASPMPRDGLACLRLLWPPRRSLRLTDVLTSLSTLMLSDSALWLASRGICTWKTKAATGRGSSAVQQAGTRPST
jgi:hypothetical protein